MTWPVARVWNDRVVTFGFLSFATAAALTPADWENLTWGFQVCFVQVYLFATPRSRRSFARELSRRRGLTIGVVLLAAQRRPIRSANGFSCGWRSLRGAAAGSAQG